MRQPPGIQSKGRGGPVRVAILLIKLHRRVGLEALIALQG